MVTFFLWETLKAATSAESGLKGNKIMDLLNIFHYIFGKI